MSDGILLMRHGTLPPNPERRFIGQQDIPLSPPGRRQAASWCRRLRDVPLAAIVCSDLSRCVETASLVRGGRDIPIIKEPAFREVSLGAWQGLTPGEVEQRFPGAYAARGSDLVRFRPEGGESFADLAERVLPAFDQATQTFAGMPLLIVAHAGVNRLVLARYMALPARYILDIPQPYACCSTVFPHA